MPFLVDIVFATVQPGIGLGVLCGLFLPATNQRTKARLWYLGQQIFRTAAGIFVNTAPIGIMEDYIRNTEKEAGNVEAEVGHTEGAHERVKRKLTHSPPGGR